MTSSSAAGGRGIRIPTWAITSGIGVAAVILGWLLRMEVVASRVPVTEKHFHEHLNDKSAHPDTAVIVEKIENLDRRLQEGGVSFEKRFDSLESSMQRQWQAISEIRKAHQ